METVIEVLGYLASGLIAISFLMKSMKKLRLLNMIGAALFVVYSIAIQAWPVAFINLFIFIINIYYLRRKEENPSQ